MLFYFFIRAFSMTIKLNNIYQELQYNLPTYYNIKIYDLQKFKSLPHLISLMDEGNNKNSNKFFNLNLEY